MATNNLGAYLDKIERCVNYDLNWSNIIDLFIPQREIFQYLCISRDKTYLFITSFVRCFIYLFLLKLVYDAYFYNAKYNEPNDYIYVLFIFLIVASIINIILLFIVIFKNVKKTRYSLTPNITPYFGSGDQAGRVMTDIYPE